MAQWVEAALALPLLLVLLGFDTAVVRDHVRNINKSPNHAVLTIRHWAKPRKHKPLAAKDPPDPKHCHHLLPAKPTAMPFFFRGVKMLKEKSIGCHSDDVHTANSQYWAGRNSSQLESNVFNNNNILQSKFWWFWWLTCIGFNVKGFGCLEKCCINPVDVGDDSYHYC